jgi:hypothetical protein
MRAVRIECAAPSLEGDPRAQFASQFITWDYRGLLDSPTENLRLMCECVSRGAVLPAEGFKIGGITFIEVLEEWSTDFLTHHLIVLEFDTNLVSPYFSNNDMTIMSGTNYTPSEGLVLQVTGRQSSLLRLLKGIRSRMSVERVTTAKKSEGISLDGPSLQQHLIIRTAFDNGWYEVPKKISIRNLANKLGLSKSTLADQLVKAEGLVVSGFLGKGKI